MKRGIITFFFGVLCFYQCERFPFFHIFDSLSTIQNSFLFILLLGLLLGLLGIGVFFVQQRVDSRSYKSLGFFLVFLFIAGFFWAGMRAAPLMLQRVVLHDQAHTIHARVEVISIPRVNDQRSQFDAVIRRIEQSGFAALQGANLRVSWYRDYADLKAGQTWDMSLRIKPVNGFMNPGGMDYESYLFQQGITATAYVRDAELVSDQSSSLVGKLHRFRQALRDQMVVLNSELHQTIPALTVGVRDGLSEEQWEVLRLSGTSHLMAISGLHIGLVAGLAFFLGRWLWSMTITGLRFVNAQQAGAISAIFAALVYALLAGFTVPTQRALIMTAVIMLSVIQSKRLPIRRMDAFIYALIAVVLFDPSAVISAGFWLSFLAVGIIFYVSSARISRKNTRLTRVVQGFRIHALLALGIAPISCFFFAQSPILSPLANFIAVPLVGLLVTPISLLACLLLPLHEGLASGLFSIANTIIHWIWPLLDYLASFKGWLITPGALPWWSVLLALIGIALLLIPRGLPGRSLGLIALLPMALGFVPHQDEGEFKLTLLDVGQGLSAVIQTQNHVLVYDTGPSFSKRFDTGKAVVVPYLRDQRQTQLDKLIVSHGDNDHRGGFLSLVEALPIDEVLTSVPDQLLNDLVLSELENSSDKKSVQVRACKAGQTWHWDGVDFHVLHPDSGEVHLEEGNDASCVIKVSNGKYSVLLSGDIEAGGEVQLLAKDSPNGSSLKSDILIVPHHGSNTSSTPDFLEAVNPELAIFPVGYLNRFGFPKEEIIARYDAASISYLTTAESGAISLQIGQEIELVEEYRTDHRRFWHR